ncbi:MAG: S8 family serine peptidase [bacterium]|nr:S8 family serine peptidase [bacterium]
MFLSIGFANFALMLLVIPSAAAGPFNDTDPLLTSFAGVRDRDGNGVEDVLDDWRAGRVAWNTVREKAVAGPLRATADKAAPAWEAVTAPPGPGPWSRGRTRILHFGGDRAAAHDKAAAAGACELLHRTDRFGGLQVLALDEAGLAGYLDAASGGTILLDRDGVPALAETRALVGADHLYDPAWELGDDWTGTVAILDSGCDTAHGDLGDHNDDDADGPAPAVGDPGDWYPADDGWPLFDGYKVVGWHDVTDDFPAAAGPWDYHHHGTALASVVAGSGRENPDHNGVVPGGRLTVVKFYDFDMTWHAWAGDFLAACDWVLANRETYRIRAVLAAVNWDVDAGISAAMSDLVDAGVVPVVAAGNHGATGSPGYPAAAADALTCGGVNHTGAVAAFSGRGLPGQGKPDLVAPAGGLLTASGRIQVCDNEPNDTYSGRWGTSLAAAFVSGGVYVLDEALRERGTDLGTGRDAARLRILALEATCAPVSAMETADGTATTPLDGTAEQAAGAGLLRVDAAVALLADPLTPGADQVDALSADWTRPVVARRLSTAENVRYLVEVVPEPGLDVAVHVLDPVGVMSGVNDVSVYRDMSGAGVSEFVYVRPDPGHWLGLVVKRTAGEGNVALRLREADTFPSQTSLRTLPGMVSGAPNAGHFGAGGVPALIVPSRVTVDDAARALSYVGVDGSGRPGWPVFLFPHSSAQGNLRQPLVWNLDGQPGDEIVVSSEYGSVYFVDVDGAVVEQALAFNRSLTRAVGLEAGGDRRIAVVDKLGAVFLWDSDGGLLDQNDLGHTLPLAPACGRLDASGADRLVVAFSDGHVTALNAALDPLPGWPIELGATLTLAPVLVDLDEDGDHEVAVPALASDGTLRVHLRSGDGTPAPGDGTILALGGGAEWLAVSGALVTGRHGNGELGLTLAGIVANGASGDEAAWSGGTVTLRGDGSVVATDFATFSVEATTTQGQLLLDRALVPTPLAWNQAGGSATEPAVLLNLEWAEVLYGLTSMPGSLTGWYQPAVDGLPIWNPLVRGGPAVAEYGRIETALLDPGDGALLRAHAFDEELHLVPVVSAVTGAVVWPVERADGRNSGAYALIGPVAAVDPMPAHRSGLAVFPNPGSGRFAFRVDGSTGTERVIVDVVDLRGRRVRRLAGAVESIRWDGQTSMGGPAAAGTYFAVLRTGGSVRTSRFVLTR